MITEMTISTNAFSSLSYNELMDIEAGGLFSKIASNVGCVLIGAGGIVGGVCLMAVPEPTPVTQVGGWAAIVAGVGSFCEIPAIWGW